MLPCPGEHAADRGSGEDGEPADERRLPAVAVGDRSEEELADRQAGSEAAGMMTQIATSLGKYGAALDAFKRKPQSAP